MKRLKIYSLVFVALLINMASMCSNDDDGFINSTPQDPTPVINTASNGTWRISFYEDDGTDETYHFTGYNFTFGASNVLSASNGTNTYNGTWSVTNSDDSNDDNPSNNSNDLDFNIIFNAPVVFANELTDDWDIISYSSTKIELIDVSGGNGGTDYLTFEKN